MVFATQVGITTVASSHSVWVLKLFTHGRGDISHHVSLAHRKGDMVNLASAISVDKFIFTHNPAL